MAQGRPSFPKNTQVGGFAYGADQGMDWITGASKAGLSIQSFRVVSAGAPDTVNFKNLGLSDMSDTSYNVIVQGETAAAVSVDQSTMATTGFDILGGAAAEILHVLVIGRLKNQVG